MTKCWNRGGGPPGVIVLCWALVVVGVPSCDVGTDGRTHYCPEVLDRERVYPSPDTVVELIGAETRFRVLEGTDVNARAVTYWFLDYQETGGAPVAVTTDGAYTLDSCRSELRVDRSHWLEAFVLSDGGQLDWEDGRTVTGCHEYVAWVLDSLAFCP